MLRNIVATVNLDCRLDLKTIALHARNAEYNPKVLADSRLASLNFCMLTAPAFCGCHHAYPRAQDDCFDLRIRQDGCHWRQV
jgi:hypothetical protein